MTKQAQYNPYAAVNTNLKFVNTMDGRRPLTSQDPNTSSVAAVAGAVSPAPPWTGNNNHWNGALPVPGALVGTGGGPGAPGPGPGPGPGLSIGSTSTDSAMVPAQQAQPYPGHDRNGQNMNRGRSAARRQHQDHHRRHCCHRRRPSRNHGGGGGSTTLRYMHDQTTNIHDRLSGCQPGVPPEVEEWEEAMRLGLDRLTEIIDHPRPPYGYDFGDAFIDPDSARGLNFDQAGYQYEEYYQYP
ncbi:hypothetical protein QBC37DRAFT_455084 [Rhypophila decipiens]|uniref:Uncharacterized protein n=1 Tax=Rhypophila decipiens TaxID=261697 RepID=A0AAN6YDF0_9PEZI|nr:hypothetical protein QBC37DRAFT_455084 [Rhypophila decipiens]